MRQRNQIANWVRRMASPETWALCALILFAVSLAGRAPEGPHLGHLLRLVAGDRAARRTLHQGVAQREAHGHGGIVAAAFPPCLGQIALQELHVRDLVAHALALVVGEVAREIGQHLRCGHVPQGVHVLPAVGGLDLAEQTLEGVIVRRADEKRRRGRGGKTSRLTANAAPMPASTM